MRRTLIAGIAGIALLAPAGVAQADHTHVRALPTGNCVVIAGNGKEKLVVLPRSVLANNPNVDADDAGALPLNRRHPLHLLVHLGVPGERGTIAVMGSAQDPCASTGAYVNRRP